ncbi:MAG: hypothetical protein A3C88_01035 [Candidatus Yanofskybacteria bacterium RIFCSPHIGHO2_02_FULL_50_12]|uniref:DUF4921 domain-containing protein n=1 Tax=Candidatus Yanofskybacteria bacterium RIFCSPHIGHO2_02_FULL_50_12 TaxID=1802685 RepID=A0A1F8FY45_9BACT|nr:MAG: hypothetical protein A3C88_01035 [Candidatus Yanofskybacteria bacterium RIFCSPHIGHO2_02_FULL_50_12]
MLNEFRQDPVSGDWVLFATQRAKRPGAKEKDAFYQTAEECLFEPHKLSNQEKPVAAYYQGKAVDISDPDALVGAGWTTVVLPNKFPALKHGICVPAVARGPFLVAEGAGFHELVITRDHEKHFAQFTEAETAEVLQAYLDRFKTIAADNCGEYVMIFHNHGHLAGASIYHNHSQILSMPIIPTGILKNIRGAQDYFEKTGKRVHEVLLQWERDEQKRIIFENEKFIVLCPFVSRTPYEMRIFPKSASAYFGEMSADDLPQLAQALNQAIGRLDHALGNADYNFFIHTAPPKRADAPSYDFYHWHIEIMPRFSIDAGLEFGTNVFVNPVDPDEAAEQLRNAHV